MSSSPVARPAISCATPFSFWPVPFSSCSADLRRNVPMLSSPPLMKRVQKPFLVPLLKRLSSRNDSRPHYLTRNYGWAATAMVRRLFERMRELQDAPFGAVPADELNAYGE